MITVKMDEDYLVDLLMHRVEHWTDDDITFKLYEQMYEEYANSGAFDGMEINIWEIVDNDYINYCDVVSPGDEGYDEIDACYKENGLGDCSCEDCRGDFIEAEYDGNYLIRY
jgi:hypothetical protein